MQGYQGFMPSYAAQAVRVSRLLVNNAANGNCINNNHHPIHNNSIRNTTNPIIHNNINNHHHNYTAATTNNNNSNHNHNNDNNNNNSSSNNNNSNLQHHPMRDIRRVQYATTTTTTTTAAAAGTTTTVPRRNNDDDNDDSSAGDELLSSEDEHHDKDNNNNNNNNNNNKQGAPPAKTAIPNSPPPEDGTRPAFVVEGIGDITKPFFSEWPVEARSLHVSYLEVPYNKSSLIWNAFTMTTWDHPVPKERGRACCNFCGNTLKVDHGISCLSRHLKYCTNDKGSSIFFSYWNRIKNDKETLKSLAPAKRSVMPAYSRLRRDLFPDAATTTTTTALRRNHHSNKDNDTHHAETTNNGGTITADNNHPVPHDSQNLAAVVEILYATRKRLYSEMETHLYSSSKRFRDATEKSLRNIESRIDAFERGC